MGENKELRGSLLRCLLLTEGEPAVVAQRLTKLGAPYVRVTAKDVWFPRGRKQPTEARFSVRSELLEEPQRKELISWWLTHAGNTPNWDIASKAKIDGRSGLLLVEAKGHVGELSKDGKKLKENASKNSKANHKKINEAIAEANRELNKKVTGFNISIDSHYQLSNRFAFAWKLASMGIPVALVYLGFILEDEMSGRILIRDMEHWRETVFEYADGYVPKRVWGDKIMVNGTPIYLLIRARKIDKPED